MVVGISLSTWIKKKDVLMQLYLTVRYLFMQDWYLKDVGTD